MAGPRHPGLSWAQTAVLACVLSVVVYYLSSNACPTEPHADFHPQTASSSQIDASSVQQLRPPGGAGSGKLHVLVTGGAGFIGSHAALRLLEEGHAVTVIDNLSRGNPGAIDVLRENSSPAFFQFVNLDLGDKRLLLDVFRKAHFDLVMHFAAVAYVGESMEQPLRYYHNITANTVNVLEAMLETGVKKLVFSSTCATYGNPDQLPVTEETPTKPINPYGMAKLMAEKQIRDLLSANRDMYAIILRYFNVYGSDPAGQLGEYPRPELRQHGRITGACMDAALGLVPQLTLLGTNHPTPDGTTIRDYIHVSDLVDAHVLGMSNLANPPTLYNVGTGKGVSLREFIDACKAATGKAIKVVEEKEARPGDYAAVYSDVAKIHKELGWQAKYTNILEGLQHAWSWRSMHPNGY